MQLAQEVPIEGEDAVSERTSAVMNYNTRTGRRGRSISIDRAEHEVVVTVWLMLSDEFLRFLSRSVGTDCISRASP